jgi:hypothetical protein
MKDAGSKKEFNPFEALLSLDHQPLVEVETIGSKLYSDLFLDDARVGRRPLHDEREARFYKDTFRHAFFRSPGDYEIDVRRVARIHWVLPMIAGKLYKSECWELVDCDGIEKRAYVCFGLGYIVWLKLRADGRWCFLTAYTAPSRTLRKYVQGGKRVAKF